MHLIRRHISINSIRGDHKMRRRIMISYIYIGLDIKFNYSSSSDHADKKNRFHSNNKITIKLAILLLKFLHLQTSQLRRWKLVYASLRRLIANSDCGRPLLYSHSGSGLQRSKRSNQSTTFAEDCFTHSVNITSRPNNIRKIKNKTRFSSCRSNTMEQLIS